MKMILRIRRRGPGAAHARPVQVAQYLLAMFGSAAIAYCAAAYLESALYYRFEASRLRSAPLQPDRASPIRAAVRPGWPLGEIAIPRIGISAVIVEGVEAADLKIAAGHVPGTALPGGPGNTAIAAHRDTLFRNLRKIQPKDIIKLRTPYGQYLYTVEWTRVVDPSDVDALKASAEPVLTLITCYPFYYVGPAPRRFVVRARETGGNLPEEGALGQPIGQSPCSRDDLRPFKN